LTGLFAKYGITEYAVIPASETEIINERTFPKTAKSVIVFLIPYKTDVGNDSKYIFGRFARIRDYHSVSRMFYEKIRTELEALTGGKTYFFCDNSPINEKAAAEHAGLGMRGKNSLLINKKYGSFVFISEIFTETELETHTFSHESLCDGCDACIRACPNGALPCDFTKCLSFISQKKTKSDEERRLLKEKKVIWGCDICQNVCRVNKSAPNTPIKAFDSLYITDGEIEQIPNMSEEEYKQYSFSYRKQSVITENIYNVIDRKNI
jgi:epoxyqueuosine reductase QueG